MSVRIVYDGACPFCDDYVRFQELRAALGAVELVDARSRPEVLRELDIDPAALEDGMVVVADGRAYHGADAMFFLAHASHPPRRWWVRWVARVSRSRASARFVYPALRWGRRVVLRLIGVPRFPR